MRVLVELLALLIVACSPLGSPVAPDVPGDWHGSDGREFPILEVREGRDLLLDTPLGPLRVDWAVGLQDDAARLGDLDRLLAHARDEGLDLQELTLYRTALAATYLYSPQLVVLPEGVLIASDPEVLRARADEGHERALVALGRAVERVAASLERRETDHASLSALLQILAQLGGKNDASASFDILQPSFARRLVRHGWLAQLDLEEAAIAELEAAVFEAESLRPLKQYASARSRLVYSEDAFGRGAWVLSTPERSGYSRLASPPAYYADSAPLISVVHLPPGADPISEAEGWLAAEVYRGDVRLVGWDRERGFFANDPAWRQLVAVSDAGEGGFELRGAVPPHVLVTRLDGDVLALITAHGTVRPAAGGSPQEAERFFAEAAAALPDAAHLDLIGEYLLAYVYDSPDTRRPWLVGTLRWTGDIHQTASQTLATHTGGMYRGDCDDLSELYQEVAGRQGKNAHLIGLPAHAALAWAERGDDDTWQTYLLQTGRPLEFRGDTLEVSLEKLYKHFGSGEVLDTTRLEVLLRFSGENTRSSWFLSSRIFSDPDYASTMIDIQRDWHFQTYHRAIAKMKALIGSGDRDPANLAELAGLYRYTGQYEESVATLREAMEMLEDGESSLSLEVDRAAVLYAARRKDEARNLAREIFDVRLPQLEEEMQVPLLDPVLDLVDALVVDGNDVELALEVLARRLAPRVDEAMRVLVEWAQTDDFDPEYWRDGGDEKARSQLRRYAGNSIAVLRATAGTSSQREDWSRVAESLGRWFEGIAFRDVEGSETVLRRYALLGRYYEALYGVDSLRGRISASPPPGSGGRAHTDRSAGATLLDDDLAWASIAPAFWAGAQRDLFARDRQSVSTERVVVLAERVARARAQARALGMDHQSFDGDVHTSALLAAVFARDYPRLRLQLREVKLANDRQQLWETASWIAAIARFLSLDQYADVLEIWRQELNYKPMYFWIAWNAALSGAEEHALLVAEVAATEFHDDPAFVEEYAFMRSLTGRGAEQRARGPVSEPAHLSSR
jgi:tetratricopeptide (TPR) repeat protein